MPVALLRLTLTQREFHGWLSYLSNKAPDVQEIQMASLSLMVAQGLGAKKVEIGDYLIRKTKEKPPPTPTGVNTPANGSLPMQDVMSVFAGIATPLK